MTETLQELPVTMPEPYEPNPSKGKSLQHSPYENTHAHLLDELRWLNRVLSAHMLQLRQVNFYEGAKGFRGFFIAHEEIDALMAEGIFEADGRVNHDVQRKRITRLLRQAQIINQEIDTRVNATVKQKRFLPLVHLANCFQLNEFEYQSLIICIAPQIDARYEKLYAYLQNDQTRKNPSVDLILSLLCSSTEARLQFLSCFHSAAKLRHYGLIESINEYEAASATQHFLKADARIVSYALGNDAVDHRLLMYLRLFPPLKWDQILVEAALQVRLKRLFKRAVDNTTNERPVFYFYGRPGVGKKMLARGLCGEIGQPLAVVDMVSLLRNPDFVQGRIRLILREGALQPCAVYFDHFERLEGSNEENPSLIRGIIQEIREAGWITFIGSEKPLFNELLDLPNPYPVEIPRPSCTLQEALWESRLDGALKKGEVLDLGQLTSRFDLTPSQICRAVRFSKQAALVHDPENGAVGLDDLMAGSRVQSQPRLSALACKIEPKYQWKDLVLPEEHMTQLHELTSYVKYRQVVMGDWGFGRKLSLGRGLNALFAGPSGTGKTMAAEVIANDLGLDLYKIDLSTVVSKYIGETEKNLNRVFTEAEHSNAILFFDEADALFGKRSEVKDAHDRYANIEIGYLLQKMEEYEGTVIMATNLSRNMDEAFVRRMHFTIEFPFPTEKYRRRIWEGIWPEDTPCSPELDLDFIAHRFELSGGNIRNIALASAFVAAENGGVINMSHLLRATRREYQKMGKVVAEGEFRKP